MIYFTICARNYLAYARTLRASLKAAEPEATFWTVLIEDRPADGAELIEDVLYASELDIPGFWDMALRYTVMELATAVKPFVFLHLLGQGAKAVTYLDPDIQVFRPLQAVHALIANGAACVLTPHSTEPLEDGGDPDDVRLMRTGAYNLGFAAFKTGRDSTAFLEWWGRRCQADCRVALDEGLFVDQKFMDLAPSYLDRCAILRDPGHNVAYWNLPNREVRRDADGWSVNGQPLVFFHFSGVKPGDASVFSKHQDRYTGRNVGPAGELLKGYLAALEANGHDRVKGLPYSYGAFGDGTPIPDFARAVYAEARRDPDLGLTREEAFSADFKVFNAPAPEVARLGRPPITRLAHAVWKGRQDLRAAFPLETPESALAFARWFVDSAGREHGLEEVFIAPVREGLRDADGGGAAAASTGLVSAARLTAGERLARAALKAAPRARDLYLKLPVAWREPVKQALLKAGYGRAMAAQSASAVALDPRPQLDPKLEPGVTVAGYLQAESGVGEGARKAVAALLEADVAVTAVAFSAEDGFLERQGGAWRALAGGPARQVLISHVNADQTPRLPYLMDVTPYAATYRIGYWVWELPRLPEAWAGAAEFVHEIWTPSDYCRQAIAATVDRPVHVIPHAVDIPVAPPEPFARETTRFVTAFDFRSFMARKNPEGAIRAFRDAFPADAPVELVIKAHGGRRRPRDRARLLELIADDPRIRLEERVMDRTELDAFRAGMDCFVSLHRSEGFGLNLAEAMAWGRPVIATDHGATAEYVDGSVGYPVAARETVVTDGAYPHAEGQSWAEPEHEAAVAAFRAVHDDLGQARLRGRAARRRATERFSPAVVGRLMRSRLDELQRGLARRGAAAE